MGHRRIAFCLLALGCFAASAPRLLAAEPDATPNATNNSPLFNVQAYVIKSNPAVFTNAPAPTLSEYTGTNVSLERIVKAASEALFQFQKRGYPNANISFAKEQITNGVVTMNVYQGVFPQVLISGKSWFRPGELEAAAQPPATATNTTTTARTNAEPHFTVEAYQITGNTLLSTNTLMSLFAKATGTNVTLSDIKKVAGDLQLEYRDRGYPTVHVAVPMQSITNETIKISVFEGRLSEIQVAKNHYFSSNNVMRALPSLETNIILLRPVFQAELDRANANRDRQIYPLIKPGAEPNTTILELDVKDRLPLHGKVELDNQSSPGTPELRVNSSAVYGNLWQLDHSLGIQYSFSPEQYKMGSEWPFYDQPLVANYSGFYRMPLGDPESISDQVASQPGSFGYDEATRRFQLPPPSGTPELNFYASRSTIDTGQLQTPTETVTQTTNLTVTSHNLQEDLTVNQAMGFRLSLPVRQVEDVRSTFSGGFDYKYYDDKSDAAYIYDFIQAIPTGGGLTNYSDTMYTSPVPTTEKTVRYLPMSLRWDGSRPDKMGEFDLGLSYSANFLGGRIWHNQPGFTNVANSPRANGYYQTLGGSLTRSQNFFHNWNLLLRADGQWANQPLISNEQFGIGGLAGVRGYREGEVFGDEGWRITAEQRTPTAVIGTVYGGYKLTVRGSIYMDYARVYLLDPQGRPGSTPLWGTGLGFTASIGPHWDARFLFSVPLLNSPTTEALQPRADFALTSQF